MARPSKLSPDQWSRVEARFLSGESASALAREFGIDEAAIRRKFRRDSPIVREAAEKLADGHRAVAALPVALQPVAISLAEKLRGISECLATAAHHGARTSATMKAAASKQADRFAALMEAAGDSADPMDHQDKLQAISALTKIGNEAASLGVGLLAANRDRMAKSEEIATTTRPAAGMTDDELAAIASRSA